MKIKTSQGFKIETDKPMLRGNKLDSTPVNAKAAFEAAAGVWDTVAKENARINAKQEKLIDNKISSRTEYAHEQALAAAEKADPDQWETVYNETYERELQPLFAELEGNNQRTKRARNYTQGYKLSNITNVQNTVKTAQDAHLQVGVQAWAEKERGLLASDNGTAYARSLVSLATLKSKIDSLVRDGVWDEATGELKFIEYGRELYAEVLLAQVRLGGPQQVDMVQSLINNELDEDDIQKVFGTTTLGLLTSSMKSALQDAIDSKRSESRNRVGNDVNKSVDLAISAGSNYAAIEEIVNNGERKLTGDSTAEASPTELSNLKTKYIGAKIDSEDNKRSPIALDASHDELLTEFKGDPDAIRTINNYYENVRQQQLAKGARLFDETQKRFTNEKLAAGEDPTWADMVTAVAGMNTQWITDDGNRILSRDEAAVMLVERYMQTIDWNNPATLEASGAMEKIDAILGIEETIPDTVKGEIFDISPQFWNLKETVANHELWAKNQEGRTTSVRGLEADAWIQKATSGNLENLTNVEVTYIDPDTGQEVTKNLLKPGTDLVNAITPELNTAISGRLKTLTTQEQMDISREFAKYGVFLNSYKEHLKSYYIDPKNTNIVGLMGEIASLRTVRGGKDFSNDQWTQLLSLPVGKPTNTEEAAVYFALNFEKTVGGGGNDAVVQYIKGGNGDELRRIQLLSEMTLWYSDLINRSYHTTTISKEERGRYDALRNKVIEAVGGNSNGLVTPEQLQLSTFIALNAAMLYTTPGEAATTETPTIGRMEEVIPYLIPEIQAVQVSGHTLSHPVQGTWVNWTPGRGVNFRNSSTRGSTNAEDFKIGFGLENKIANECIVNASRMHENVAAAEEMLGVVFSYIEGGLVGNTFRRKISGSAMDFVIENFAQFKWDNADRGGFLDILTNVAQIYTHTPDDVYEASLDDRVFFDDMVAYPIIDEQTGMPTQGYAIFRYDSNLNTIVPLSDTTFAKEGVLTLDPEWLDAHPSIAPNDVLNIMAKIEASAQGGGTDRPSSTQKFSQGQKMSYEQISQQVGPRLIGDFASILFLDEDGNFDEELYEKGEITDLDAWDNILRGWALENGVEVVDEIEEKSDD